MTAVPDQHVEPDGDVDVVIAIPDQHVEPNRNVNVVTAVHKKLLEEIQSKPAKEEQ